MAPKIVWSRAEELADLKCGALNLPQCWDSALLPAPQLTEASRPSFDDYPPYSNTLTGVGSAGELPAVADVLLTNREPVSTVRLDFYMWWALCPAESSPRSY